METLVTNILKLKETVPCPLVAISGIDGSGKSSLAGQLSKSLTEKGLNVLLLPLDQFHNPPEMRFGSPNPGKHFYEGAFDFDRIFDQLLEPLRSTQRIDVTLEVTRLPEDDRFLKRFYYEDVDVILLEGIFLLKNTLKNRFDYKVWVDCSFRTALERALDYHQAGEQRDAAARDYAEIYHAAQKQHYSIDEPKASADFILVNDPRLARGPDILLSQPVVKGHLAPGLNWFSEPQDWRLENNKLVILPDSISDFWQRTHYGFQNDNGHLLYIETDRDFVMQTHARFKPLHQFDQCGLMVRLDADNWLKTSIEYQLENPASMGAVVTNFGYSDWSIQPVAQQVNEAWFRVERDRHDFVVDISLDGQSWSRIRVCRLHQAKGIVKCGLYCCSPIAGGYEVHFDQLEIKELII